MGGLMKTFWIVLCLAGVASLAAFATIEPDGRVSHSTRHGGVMPVSTPTDAQTLYGRVVEACWKMTSEPELICPPMGSGDAVRSAVYRFDGTPPFEHE